MADFCGKMLQRDPTDRPTISKCLEHPWVVGGEPVAEVLAAYIQATMPHGIQTTRPAGTARLGKRGNVDVASCSSSRWGLVV